MCGIVGVHNYASTSVPLSDALLQRMTDTIRHRGPDDAGTWINPDGRVGMAFRRLSIIDLSPNGHQPMTNEDGSIHIVFNGEIYNYRDLRPDLERKGHRFRSQTDTEVILHLYEEYGAAAIDKLDGMFAFGIWDSRKEQWLLVRDRLGVKPLYFTQQRGVLIFASEIKAILAHPLITAELNPVAMSHYLTFKAAPAPETMFAGIRKVPMGHLLTADRHGGVAVRAYWDAATSACAPIPREADAVDRVRDLFQAAVKKRMVADVPVGAFLSGGLDSSAVVAEMAALASGAVKTFSVGIRGMPKFSEFAHARHVAQRFGTDHHEAEIGVEEVEAYLPLLVHQQDEPLSDPVCVPLYYVSRLAAAAGVPVVLVGEGSDEQFFGYDSRIDYLRRHYRFWRPLLRVPRPLLAAGAATARIIARGSGASRRVHRILHQAATSGPMFLGSLAFDQELKDEMFTPGAIDEAVAREVIDRFLVDLRRACPTADIGAQVMYTDLRLRLSELLLMRVDKITMSQSLEAREPFMDYRLIEYTMGLPVALKLKGWNAKSLLKQAMRGTVPDRIIDRVKQPFAAPIDDWLRQGLAPFARRVIFDSRLRRRGLFRYDRIEAMLDAHERGAEEHGVRIWALMNLSAWYDHWIEGQSLS